MEVYESNANTHPKMLVVMISLNVTGWSTPQIGVALKRYHPRLSQDQTRHQTAAVICL
jgi:hypothetical protein